MIGPTKYICMHASLKLESTIGLVEEGPACMYQNPGIETIQFNMPAMTILAGSTITTDQGVVTPIGPVLTTATAVKLWSSGQGSFKKTVKRSRQIQAANRSTVKAHKTN